MELQHTFAFTVWREITARQDFSREDFFLNDEKKSCKSTQSISFSPSGDALWNELRDQLLMRWWSSEFQQAREPISKKMCLLTFLVWCEIFHRQAFPKRKRRRKEKMVKMKKSISLVADLSCLSLLVWQIRSCSWCPRSSRTFSPRILGRAHFPILTRHKVRAGTFNQEFHKDEVAPSQSPSSDKIGQYARKKELKEPQGDGRGGESHDNWVLSKIKSNQTMEARSRDSIA